MTYPPAFQTALTREPITLTIPYSILTSDNGRDKFALSRGKLILTSKYRDRKAAVKITAGSQYRGALIESPVAVTTVLYAPDRRRRDISNFNKFVNDALTGVVWVDDSQIDQITNIRGPIDRANPRLVVTVIPEWRLQ